MAKLNIKVDDCTVNFTSKLDRMINDFKLRFNDFGKYTSTLQYLSTNVDYLKSQSTSKTAQRVQDKAKVHTEMRKVKRSISDIEKAMVQVAEELDQVKTQAGSVDDKLVELADSKFNPLIDEFNRASRENQSVIRDFNRARLNSATQLGDYEMSKMSSTQVLGKKDGSYTRKGLQVRRRRTHLENVDLQSSLNTQLMAPSISITADPDATQQSQQS